MYGGGGWLGAVERRTFSNVHVALVPSSPLRPLACLLHAARPGPLPGSAYCAPAQRRAMANLAAAPTSPVWHALPASSSRPVWSGSARPFVPSCFIPVIAREGAGQAGTWGEADEHGHMRAQACDWRVFGPSADITTCNEGDTPFRHACVVLVSTPPQLNSTQTQPAPLTSFSPLSASRPPPPRSHPHPSTCTPVAHHPLQTRASGPTTPAPSTPRLPSAASSATTALRVQKRAAVQAARASGMLSKGLMKWVRRVRGVGIDLLSIEGQAHVDGCGEAREARWRRGVTRVVVWMVV